MHDEGGGCRGGRRRSAHGIPAPVGGGYPLFADGKIVGAIGVGGGTEAQDCEIAEHVVRVFEAAE